MPTMLGSLLTPHKFAYPSCAHRKSLRMKAKEVVIACKVVRKMRAVGIEFLSLPYLSSLEVGVLKTKVVACVCLARVQPLSDLC